ALTYKVKDFKENLLYILTAPFIYAMIVPAVIMDLFIEIYQAVCFPVYGIQKVRREDYIKHDRHKLQYLNSLKKVNCAYCAYFNGLISYVREVASRTEQYWCPIKHATQPKHRHERYKNFIPYGDQESLEREWEKHRRSLL